MNSPEDKLLLAHLYDCLAACEKKGAPVFSDFMDPVRAEKFKAALGSGVMSWGGYADAERRILGFFPDGRAGGVAEFPIKILRAEYNRRFNSAPSHI